MRASQALRQATHSSGNSWSLHVAIGKSAKAGSLEDAMLLKLAPRAVRGAVLLGWRVSRTNKREAPRGSMRGDRWGLAGACVLQEN
jgi:hypothetical protein